MQNELIIVNMIMCMIAGTHNPGPPTYAHDIHMPSPLPICSILLSLHADDCAHNICDMHQI